eukprot:m.347799 g.347799  ORF g.347799 m.347799 type:complete len:86 (-) comp34096_c0_seq1:74-331(-)
MRNSSSFETLAVVFVELYCRQASIVLDCCNVTLAQQSNNKQRNISMFQEPSFTLLRFFSYQNEEEERYVSNLYMLLFCFRKDKFL